MNALRFVEHCIDTYADRAWRMAYALLSNTHDADDLLQQSFVIAWRKADQAPRDNPWPWLAAIVAGGQSFLASPWSVMRIMRPSLCRFCQVYTPEWVGFSLHSSLFDDNHNCGVDRFLDQ